MIYPNIVGKLVKAKATAAVKTVAKRGTAKVAVSRNVTNELVNRNRSYRNQLADLKSGLKDCLNISSRVYTSRFGEASIWVEMQYANGVKAIGIAKTRESELLVSSFLKASGSFAPKRATSATSKRKAA